MDPPPIPPGFLQLSIKYEYFKRSCLTQNAQNLQQMIFSDLTRNAVQHIPHIEPEFNDDSSSAPKRKMDQDSVENKPPPAKKRKLEDPEEEDNLKKKKKLETVKPPIKRNSEYESTDSEGSCVVPDPDPDSDDSDVEDDDKEEPELDFGNLITLKDIKRMTKKFAESECRKLASYRKLIAYIIEIMSIRVAVPYEAYGVAIPFKTEAHPNTIHVIISPRSIVISVNTWKVFTLTSLQYWSHEEGCLFRYGDKVRLVKGVKYQELAAKHFFILVRDKRNEIEILQIRIKEFDPKRDPATYPFRSFYHKIGRLFSELFKLDWDGIHVRNFEMTSVHYMGEPETGAKILDCIVPYLCPKVIYKIKLRVWDDEEVQELRGFTEDDTSLIIPHHWIPPEKVWGNAAELDILDGNIEMRKFNWAWIHESVRLVISPEEFESLYRACPVQKIYDLKRSHRMKFRFGNGFDIGKSERIFLEYTDQRKNNLRNYKMPSTVIRVKFTNTFVEFYIVREKLHVRSYDSIDWSFLD